MLILDTSDFMITKNKARIISSKVSNNPGMLLVWADYCPYCHDFLPVFENLSKQLGNRFPCVSIENKNISQGLRNVLDITGFPTLYFFDQNGVIISKYKGTRQQDKIIDHICKVYHHCVKHH